MVFGLEQVGRFFNAIHEFLIGSGLVIKVFFAFLVFIVLNAAFVFFYYKLLTTLPNLIAKIRYLVRRIDEWLD
jgi:hypothetical protein